MSNINPDSLEGRDINNLFHPTTNFRNLIQDGPLVIKEGKGVFVRDHAGREYIEGLAGLWCTSLGYGIEELADAAREAMTTMGFAHLFGGRSHESAIELAEKINALSPIGKGKVFFGTSGSDANDTQIKIIRYYFNAIGKPEKKTIIAHNRGYHGVGIGSGSLTGIPVNHDMFDLPIDGVAHVRCPHYYHEAEPGETEEEFSSRLAQELEELIFELGPEKVAAFIAEPIMGAGGVVVPPTTYYKKVQEVLKRHEVLLIDDEVICGFGRTGNAFGAQTLGMEPDTVSIAKALSSGYQPISAVMIPDRMYDALVEPSANNGVFGHGYTYSGHQVSCAVASRTLDLYDEWDVFDHVSSVSADFQAKLRIFSDHPLVGEARGVGLIGAVEFVQNKITKSSFSPAGLVGQYCIARCLDQGLILRALKDTIAFCPPLVITSDEIEELFTRFTKALDETWKWVKETDTLEK